MPELDMLVDQMTLAEQVSLLSGEDFWSLPAIPRLNIAKLRVTDGPNGARGGGSLIGGVTAAAFPVGIALGATWNPLLLAEIGAALAEEVRSKGAHVLLAPTVNIHRSVTNGRNFECYAEDPVLTARLAVGYITGLQGAGVAATIKHFVGNESELQRTTISSEVDERTLREVYLIPFEAAVKEAGTWGVMSSYNRLNGTFTSENAWLLSGVLRDDWGYDGIVMSDWFGSHSTAPTVNAGLDLEMPGPTRDRGAKLIAAVEAGEVDATTIRTRALNILRLMDRTGALHDDAEWKERAEDRPAHRALIRRAGAEGMVLLKNEGVLPLDKPGTVAVIGPNAAAAQIMGGGSAQLNPHYAISPLQGLTEALGKRHVTHAPGCTNHRFEPLLTGDIEIDYFANTNLTGDPVHSETATEAQAFIVPPAGGGKIDLRAFSLRLRTTFTADQDGTYRVGVASAGLSRVRINGAVIADAWADWTKGQTFFEEGCDEVVGTIEMAKGQTVKVEMEFSSVPAAALIFAAYRIGIGRVMGEAEIAEAVRVASEADTVILCVGRSGEWDTEGWDVPDIALPGRQDDLIAAVLAANPNTVVVLQTGGPVEMPWLADAPAVLQAWYPGQELGNALADVLLGEVEPGGRLPQTFPALWSDNPTQSQDAEVYPGMDGKVRYEEGVFIGYRHYDRHGITPLFPFGHGLGYTSFDLDGLSATPEGASVRLTNTGDRRGCTVVQVWVSDDAPALPRPVKELKSFAKVTLDPGESEVVDLPLTPRDFAFWDPEGGQWRVRGGTHTVMVGFNATDLRAKATVTVEEALLGR